MDVVVNAFVSFGGWLRSVSGPLSVAAVATAAALPRDCQLAFSQTLHICAGWTPPFEMTPGLGPFPVCYMWFGLGVVVGIFFVVFVVLAVLVWQLTRPRAERLGVPRQRLEDRLMLHPDFALQDELRARDEGERRDDRQDAREADARNERVATNRRDRGADRDNGLEDARVELVQLLVHGGQQALQELAQQRGLEPTEMLRRVLLQGGFPEQGGIPRRVVPTRGLVVPTRNPLL